MSWSASPLAHVKAFGTSTFTTGNIDSSGADFCVAVAQYFSVAGGGTLTDSRGLTWTKLTPQNEATEVGCVIWYAKNANGGTGHNFTLTGVSILASLEASAWSGSDLTAPFDVENGFNSGTPHTTTQPGSITPSVDNCLVVWGGCIFQTTPSYSSATPAGTMIDEVADSSVYSGATFYQIQTTATAVNPTMTHANYKDAGVIASFKPAAGGVTVAQEAGIFDAQRSGAFTGLMWQ